MDPVAGAQLYAQVFSLILQAYCIGVVIGGVIRIFRRASEIA